MINRQQRLNYFAVAIGCLSTRMQSIWSPKDDDFLLWNNQKASQNASAILGNTFAAAYYAVAQLQIMFSSKALTANIASDCPSCMAIGEEFYRVTSIKAGKGIIRFPLHKFLSQQSLLCMMAMWPMVRLKRHRNMTHASMWEEDAKWDRNNTTAENHRRFILRSSFHVGFT